MEIETGLRDSLSNSILIYVYNAIETRKVRMHVWYDYNVQLRVNKKPALARAVKNYHDGFIDKDVKVRR
jgi:hypothetical protein